MKSPRYVWFWASITIILLTWTKVGQGGYAYYPWDESAHRILRGVWCLQRANCCHRRRWRWVPVIWQYIVCVANYFWKFVLHIQGNEPSVTQYFGTNIWQICSRRRPLGRLVRTSDCNGTMLDRLWCYCSEAIRWPIDEAWRQHLLEMDRELRGRWLRWGR